MGNADLRQLAALGDVTWDEVAGSVVAVDAHNWLYRYLTTTVKWTNDAVYTTSEGEEVANLVGVVQGLPKFFEHDLTPVFVFDGGVTDLKEAEVSERREKRERAEERLAEAEERGDAVEAARLEARTQRLTDVILETTRELLASSTFRSSTPPPRARRKRRTWPGGATPITPGARTTTPCCSARRELSVN